MEFHIYVTLAIFSTWIIFLTKLWYYTLILDMSFEFYITTGTQRLKYSLYLFSALIFSYYLLVVRISRIGRSLDIFELLKIGEELIYSFEVIDLFIIILFILLLVTCWILLLRCIYQFLRKCLLALYLYYYRYSKFRTISSKTLYFTLDYNIYLWKRVKIFTANKYILMGSLVIWPNSLNIIERNLFHFFIPYLIFFDIMVQDGVLSKIFIVMPWFYVYSLIRGFFILFSHMEKPENWQLSEEMYGYQRGFKF